MMTQEDKHFLNLAGEFLVAGELNRRSVACSVTYGFSKQADIIAFADDRRRTIWIEVKTTAKPEFIVGPKALDTALVSSDVFWVLVHLPEDMKKPPRYFVLTSAELCKRASAKFKQYNDGYRERHGHDYDKPGVHKLALLDVDDCESHWDVLIKELKRYGK
jgi:hypothetical protein